MQNRYKNPPPCFDAPPRLEQLPDILRDSMLTDDEVAEDNEGEARRREAIDALFKFARAEVTEARAEAARTREQLAEALARHGVEKPVAQGIAEALTPRGVAKADAQGIAKAMLALACTAHWL
jgi:hypothetical protein